MRESSVNIRHLVTATTFVPIESADNSPDAGFYDSSYYYLLPINVTALLQTTTVVGLSESMCLLFLQAE